MNTHKEHYEAIINSDVLEKGLNKADSKNEDQMLIQLVKLQSSTTKKDSKLKNIIMRGLEQASKEKPLEVTQSCTIGKRGRPKKFKEEENDLPSAPKR